ncbi:hypothetical protein ACLMMA_15045 [Micrococcus luteus]
MNELEASLIIRAGAQLLMGASSDPRSDQGYAAVKENLAAALNALAAALVNFEAGSAEPNRSVGWAQDLRRVADSLDED